jgi:hypothetical protein
VKPIQKALRAQGYDVDEKGFDRCDTCRRRTMPGVKECYDCWLEKEKEMKIEVQGHWRGELSKIRSWLNGFAMGRSTGPISFSVPGEDTIRQIIVAIDEATGEKAKKRVKKAPKK